MSNKIIEKIKKWNSIFCRGMTCRANLERDLVVIMSAILIAGVFLYKNVFVAQKIEIRQPVAQNAEKEVPAVAGAETEDINGLTEEQISTEAEKLAQQIKTDGWKMIPNRFWGFEVKYPAEWLPPATATKTNNSKWDARFQFRKKDSSENPYLGFDIVVYDASKIKELRNTEEFSTSKSEDLKSTDQCQNFEGYAIEIDDFPAEEIYVSRKDKCFNPVLFFSIVKDRYIYNIVPISKSGMEKELDPRISINENFPEYYAAASTLDFINIVRPKPAPPKPRITAPKPVSYRVVGGKLVCAKKNDKPRKSRQNKGKHLDMECCLDPDEYPNPWCTY